MIAGPQLARPIASRIDAALSGWTSLRRACRRQCRPGVLLRPVAFASLHKGRWHRASIALWPPSARPAFEVLNHNRLSPAARIDTHLAAALLARRQRFVAVFCSCLMSYFLTTEHPALPVGPRRVGTAWKDPLPHWQGNRLAALLTIASTALRSSSSRWGQASMRIVRSEGSPS